MISKSKVAIAGLMLATVALPATAYAATAKKMPTTETFHFVATAAGEGKGVVKMETAYAKGTIIVNSKTDRVCSAIVTKNLVNITAAHIHKGVKGVNGPVVVAFLTKSIGSGKMTCIIVPAASAKAIIANPAGFYVNVHTKKFPNGAVRAQL